MPSNCSRTSGASRSCTTLSRAAAFRRTPESHVRSLSRSPDANPPAHGTRRPHFANGLSRGPAQSGVSNHKHGPKSSRPPARTLPLGQGARERTRSSPTRLRPTPKSPGVAVPLKLSTSDSRCAMHFLALALSCSRDSSHLLSVSTIKPSICCNVCVTARSAVNPHYI